MNRPYGVARNAARSPRRPSMFLRATPFHDASPVSYAAILRFRGFDMTDSTTTRADRLRAARRVAEFRAEKLAALRAFFATRNVLEIEAPLLSRGASHDAHIGVIAVPYDHGDGGSAGTRYL